MYRDAGPPHWTLIQIQKFQRGMRTTGQTDGHIMLPLRIFEPVACGCMLCAQLRSAQMKFYCQLKAVFPNKNSDLIYIFLILVCFMVVSSKIVFKIYNFS